MSPAEISPVVTEQSFAASEVKSTLFHRLASVHEWPQVMRGGLTWDGASLPSDEDTILALTADEVKEVRAAVEHFNGQSRPSPIYIEHRETNYRRPWRLRQRGVSGQLPSSHSCPEAARRSA